MELDNEYKTPLRILLVEDDQSLGFVVQDALAMQGYKVHLCRDGKEGLNQFNKEEYDMCLLDVMMPKKDGFSLAEDIRKVNQEIPIVFLTAKGLDQDKILGFRIGADDYITKPFSSEELLLRIKAVLKRSHKLVPSEPSGKQKYQIGIFQFDANNYELIHGNDRKKLTKKESELLKLLTEHQGNVLERVIIGNLIWGDDSYFVGRSMDVFITKLRKYLSADPHIAITNVHGVGFRLEVKG